MEEGAILHVRSKLIELIERLETVLTIPSFSQIFGAFVAGLMVMGQYREQILALSAATVAAGEGNVFNGGPASIFCSFPGETENNLGYLFLIEFFVDSYIVSFLYMRRATHAQMLTLHFLGYHHLGLP